MLKKVKYIFLIITAFLLTTNIVKAESCDAADIERLKQIANNVEISYEHKNKYKEIDPDGDSYYIYDGYDVKISGLMNEIKIIQRDYDRKYETSSINSKGTIKDIYYSGNLVFYIYSSQCDVELKKIDIDLPKFNYYSLDKRCNRTKNFKICDPWYQGTLDDETFEENIEKYFSEHKFSQIWYYVKNTIVNHPFYISGSIIIIAILVAILLMIRKKRGELT